MSDSSIPALSEVYGLLGNRRRLLTIGYLSLFDCGAVVDVRHVARVVKAIETETIPCDVRSAEYESAYNSLIQLHLPKLAEKELIEYDSDRKTVTTKPKIGLYVFLVSIGQVTMSLDL